jgi:integrase/recombinase XerD
MKIQRVKISDHQYVWLVLDDHYLPIQPIEVFIRYLHYTEKSPDTIQSYAAHLKKFWEYLECYNKDWLKVTIADFADFVHWLRNQPSRLKDNTEKRKNERTVNTILSALSSFYRYHNQLCSDTNISLRMTSQKTPCQ